VRESGRSSNGVSTHGMWREFACPPIAARANAAKARLLKKALTVLKSHVRVVVRNRNGMGRSAWSIEAKGKSTKLGVPDDATPGEAHQIALQATWREMDKKKLRLEEGNGERFKQHFLRRYYYSAGLISPKTAKCKWTRSLRNMVLMRVGSWWGCYTLAGIGMVANEWRTRCPFCDKDEPETSGHAMLRCTKWDELREEWLGERILAIRHRLAERAEWDPENDESVLTVLLGGQPGHELMDAAEVSATPASWTAFCQGPEKHKRVVATEDRDGLTVKVLSYLSNISRGRAAVVNGLIVAKKQNH
jgi:hypothetical protein